jgi:signal transduction histidine kinase
MFDMDAVSTDVNAVRPSRPSRGALLQLVIAVCAVAVLEVAILRQRSGEPALPLALYAIVGLEFVAAGLIAWWRRPGNGTGALLGLCGLSLLLGALATSQSTFLEVVGLFLFDLPLGVTLHLLLAFPSGRVRARLSSQLVIAGYVMSIAPNAIAMMWSTDPTIPQVVHASENSDVVAAARWTENVLGSLVIAITIGILAIRVHRAKPPSRRSLSIVYGFAGAAFVLLVLVTTVVSPLLDLTAERLFELQIIPVAGIPIGFVAGLLWGGFAPTRELDNLVAWIGAKRTDQPTLRQALRDTIGDPSLELLFWLPDGDRYVSANGVPASLPTPNSGRAAVDVITATSGKIAAISYDASLVGDPELVRSAGRVVALQLEGDRLTADLLASREALRESRSRIVESADRERRRIARDLHDGLQNRLVLLALRAGQVANGIGETSPHSSQVVTLRDDLEATIADLRRLVHGVLPDLLIQRGLPAAVEELLDQTIIRSRLDVTNCERRLAPQVETAGYFVVAEALANVTKHAEARTVVVTLERVENKLRISVVDDGRGGASLASGTGLRGLADRVEALGGSLRIDSVTGSGTDLVAEIPCEL